ncbi:MAG TPA: hypothetical protein VHW68_13060 [Actinomycetota bacterium]|jgi:hypothetical protein|nr:hypothetical protein [Actinomycetota bacterium]
MQLERWTSPAGKPRVLTRLDPFEGRRYAVAAAIAFPDLRPGPSVFGSPAPGRPVRLALERRRWRAAIRTTAVGAVSVVASDVADCFPSIGECAIRSAAAHAGGDPLPLLRTLERYREAGGFGIPIGPPVSGVIADAVLSLADERARLAGCLPIRWVDDVLFAGERDAVARASRAWRDALAELGMREHDGKRTTDALDVRGSPVACDRHGIMRGS